MKEKIKNIFLGIFIIVSLYMLTVIAFLMSVDPHGIPRH